MWTAKMIHNSLGGLGNKERSPHAAFCKYYGVPKFQAQE